MDLEALIEHLRSPDAYPHPVGDVEVIQTHASVVFLAGEFAYKIKKPVDFGFLDFSTVARRRHFCQREVELNRRLAPDVYLGVVPVGGPDSEELAVKMVRLPDEATFAAKVCRGELTEADVRGLARRLAAFHRTAIAHAETATHARFGAVRRANLDNLEAIEQSAGILDMPEVVERLDARTREALHRLAPMIERRALAGRVRDTHGDLRLEHVYDLPDGLRVVDCIEFNDAFRYSDPVADAAFLAMDLRAHGAWALADAFIDAYVDASGDLDAHALFPFYEAYRASVRAKVDALQAQQPATGASRGIDVAARARAKVLLAEGLLAPPSERPCIVLMYGLPGTGKSALARRLAPAGGFAWLRSDVVRKELVGAAPLESRKAGPAAGIYDAKWTVRTYAELRARTEALLAQGRRVIVDATFKQDAERLAFVELARRWHVPVRILACETSPEVARHRIETRGPDASDADWTVYKHAAAHWDPLTPASKAVTSVVDTTPPLPTVLAAALAALAQHGCAGSTGATARSAA